MTSCQHCASSKVFLSVAPLADRRLERQARIPGKIDPGVLRHFCDERVDKRAPHRLRIDGRKVSIRQKIANDTRGISSIDKIIDYQHTLALRVKRNHLRRNSFENRQVTLV